MGLSLDASAAFIRPATRISGASRHPPRPGLAFRVGVVGHRPDRLRVADLERLANVMREILLAVKEAVATFHAQQRKLFGDAPPVFRAVSPLAEGADRLFAQAALDLGFELCCPMPFAQAEFEHDFAPPVALEDNSIERFRGLLARAEQEMRLTKFELDGNRADRGAAYGAAGRVVLNQSDLLIVVWDGQSLGKSGGTEETFAEARRRGIPVALIDARAPHAWQVLSAESPSAETPGLSRVVQEALALPTPPRAGGPQVTLDDYYAERKPRFNPALLWRWFRDLLAAGKWSFAGFRPADFETSVEPEWPRDESTAVSRLVDRLRPFYAWPDKLAVVYSDAYRSAFILCYLLAAAAVGLALLPLAATWLGARHHPGAVACSIAELILILLILAVVLGGRWRRWHERWIDYRLAAELIRHLRLMAPLGGGRPFPQIPAHLATYGNPATTWAAWYVRAVERDLGLPSADLSSAYLRQSLAHLDEMLAGQISYHQLNSGRCHKLERRLHKIGLWLLGLTLLACALHLVPGHVGGMALPRGLPWLLSFLCGFLPALGAALAGISNQGEFRRIAKRSAAMVEHLQQLRGSAAELEEQLGRPAPPQNQQMSVLVADLAGRAAKLMVKEVLDWRVVFLDQPLKTAT